MSLRDELRNIVAAKKSELARNDQENSDFERRQRSRIAPVAAVLAEIVSALDSPLVCYRDGRDCGADLCIEGDRGNPETRLRLHIIPRSETQIEGGRRERQGFEVTVAAFGSLQSLAFADFFDTEEEVSEFAGRVAAEAVGILEHGNRRG